MRETDSREGEGSVDTPDFDSFNNLLPSGQNATHSHAHDSMSPDFLKVENTLNADGKKIKLQLPLSCEPPGPSNKTKPKVWIVSITKCGLADRSSIHSTKAILHVLLY